MDQKCQIGQCYNDSVRQVKLHIPAYDGEAEQDARVEICANHLLWLKGRGWAKTPENGGDSQDLHAV